MRYLNRKLLTICIMLGVIALASGKSSKLVMSWKNPGYTGGKKFPRVLALGLSEKTEIRADFEDALAAQLAAAGVDAMPGNFILLRPEGAQVDLEYIKGQIRENAIDAVVVSRLIKVENTATYIPGAPYTAPLPYYNTFYGYYGAVYPVVYGPGYLKEEKRVRIETNLYVISSQEGELVWTGITDTFNPSNLHKAINGLVKLVVKQMQSEEVLKARPALQARPQEASRK
jgi:hypothetical protein